MNCGTDICGQCRHWNLTVDRLAEYGYGKCDARAHEADRKGLSTSAQNICRIGKFAKADPKVVAQREQDLQGAS